jgi:ketosteroid isomerase-like protein
MEESRSNIELVYAALAAYQRGDQDELRRLMDPEIEVHGESGLINAGTYHGFDGFMEWIGQWEEAWDPVTYELLDPIEVGDSLVVVPVHAVGRGAVSGVEIDSVFGWLYEIRDGLATRFHVYVTVDGAVDVARDLAKAPR